MEIKLKLIPVECWLSTALIAMQLCGNNFVFHRQAKEWISQGESPQIVENQTAGVTSFLAI